MLGHTVDISYEVRIVEGERVEPETAQSGSASG
jgi:hypothetical protein